MTTTTMPASTGLRSRGTKTILIFAGLAALLFIAIWTEAILQGRRIFGVA